MKKNITNSTLLFLHRMIRGIANSTIELFIPLIIFTKTNNIVYALLFSLVQKGVASLGFLFLKRAIRKYPIISIFISVIPSILSYLLLNLGINMPLILTLGFLSGISSVLYWGGINLIFALLDEKTDSAKFDAGDNLGRIIFTALSAYVLGSIKNSLIFVVIFACVLNIVSFIPLIANYKQLKNVIKDIPKNNQVEVIKDTKWFNLYFLTMGAFSFFAEIFLPLYLAMNGLSFSAVGIFMAASKVIKIIAGYCAKFMQAKKWEIFWIVLCSLLFLFPTIVIMLSRNNVVIYIMNLIITFSFASLYTLSFNWFCKNQNRNGFIYDSMYYKDVFQNSGRIVVIGLVYVVFASAFWVGIGTSVLNGVFAIISINKCKKDGIIEIEKKQG